MIILQWCKMQLMCLAILAYLGLVFLRDGNSLRKITQRTKCSPLFDSMFVIAEIAVLFDGITACTVNFTDVIPRGMNLLLHLGMFVSYVLYVTLLFLYWISETTGLSKKQWIRWIYIAPCIVGICLTVVFLPQLQFVQGEYTNYSMGISVYVCFISVAIYFLLTVALILAKHRNIAENKRKALFTTLICIILIMSLQIIFPEFLVTSIAIAMITISLYINMENPAIRGLELYHHEMVMGFATLVENTSNGYKTWVYPYPANSNNDSNNNTINQLKLEYMLRFNADGEGNKTWYLYLRDASGRTDSKFKNTAYMISSDGRMWEEIESVPDNLKTEFGITN